jgi:hypothetical protein
MFRFTATAIAVFMGFSNDANADVAEDLLGFSGSYKECFTIQGDDTARLACYDGLTTELSNLIAATAQSISGDSCEVESWTGSMRGTKPYMTGAVSCESGRLDYRLYEFGTDKFLTSGFTYFQGYAFQEYPEISAWPESADMRFVVSE